ncbi:MAG: hypothetical protein HYY12_05740 [Candidatus Methylomirabilis oxyfera]|nr:hypothetical protein [Candidatus Methylomirabilis oxyfera]
MKKAEVSFEKAQALVQYESSKVIIKEMIEALKDIGYRASVP